MKINYKNRIFIKLFIENNRHANNACLALARDTVNDDILIYVMKFNLCPCQLIEFWLRYDKMINLIILFTKLNKK